MAKRLPENQGLYNRANEHDACGIGFVADIKGRKSNEIVRRGLEVVIRMEHRGAESADGKTGDGAGIMIQMPHRFFKAQVADLPNAGQYGTGVIFLPADTAECAACMQEFEKVICDENLHLITWRDMPVDRTVLGDIARSAEPTIKQIFITGDGLDQDRLERKLLVARKVIENRIRNQDGALQGHDDAEAVERIFPRSSGRARRKCHRAGAFAL